MVKKTHKNKTMDFTMAILFVVIILGIIFSQVWIIVAALVMMIITLIIHFATAKARAGHLHKHPAKKAKK